jgi:hypothetical protein
MSGFELEDKVKLEHVNARREKHGEQLVTALDLKITADTGNDVLAFLNPDLKNVLYREGSPRIPNLAPVRLTGKLEHIDAKVDGVKIDDATLTSFQVEPLHDDRVRLRFRLSMHPRGKEAATLIDMAETEVKLVIGSEQGQLL